MHAGGIGAGLVALQPVTTMKIKQNLFIQASRSGYTSKKLALPVCGNLIGFEGGRNQGHAMFGVALF